MKNSFKLIILALFISTTLMGCAVNRATGSVDPKTNLLALKSMHVKKNPSDDSNINILIADKLRSKGITVTTEPEVSSSNIDATVTYIDKWMWDITMYLLELTITIRDPKTDFPLATGNSYHTSLTRLSPKEMVDEVINNIYKGTQK
ncbi:MAG: hypothetical protein U1E82_07235 [Nitrosomonas sp.]|nr:hypothetical protein [Nitrosomonas sp.]